MLPYLIGWVTWHELFSCVRCNYLFALYDTFICKVCQFSPRECFTSMCNSQILTCVHEYITWRNVCSDDILQHSFTEIRLFCALPNCMEQIHGFYYRKGCPVGNSLMPCKYIRSLPERRGILEAILWKVSIWLVCLISWIARQGKVWFIHAETDKLSSMIYIQGQNKNDSTQSSVPWIYCRFY